MGELAFGRDFEGIESGKTHSWIEDVLGSMAQSSISDTLTRFPILGTLWLFFNPGWLAGLIQAATRHQSYTIEVTNKRLQEDTDRKDFMSYLLRDREGVSSIQMAAHASDFVIAGSETTASTLAALFYYVLRTPAVRQRLESEILSSFTSYDDINATTAASLKYLHATCQEALRIFPPLPLGLPREVPKGGASVDGFWVPGGFGIFNRLAWRELHVTVAKIMYKYELDIVDKNLDWDKDVQMSLLWKKPSFSVSLTERHKS
ncbi:hypothetical protein E8E14_004500 [Neopestalotiopsis sp. 37M]|nr:hypothetical protein E8E14_004500 [Neopestalotiopsis sp. 37M]